MPDFRVVSERSEEEVRNRAVSDDLTATLNQLTANLIRIVRGAGKPDRIIDDLYACAVAFTQFAKQFEREPTAEEIAAAISLHRELPDKATELALEEKAICRAALQIVASTLRNETIERDRALADLRSVLSANEVRPFPKKKSTQPKTEP